MTTFVLRVSEVRKHLADVLSRVFYKDHSFIIERNGKPTAALVSVEDYQLVKMLRDRAEAELLRERIAAQDDLLDEPETFAAEGQPARSAAVRGEAAFNEPSALPYEVDETALAVIEAHFGQYDEIYLTPLLRKLSDELGDLEHHAPKDIVGHLEESGAVRLERRKGMPYDYTVVIINAEHPAVQKARGSAGGEQAPAGEWASEARWAAGVQNPTKEHTG